MKELVLAGFVMFLSACAGSALTQAWRAKEIALLPGPAVRLQGRNQQTVATVNTSTVKRLLLAYFRVMKAAGVYPELLIVEGEDPNAFVGLIHRRYTMAVNLGMLRLVGDEIDEFAFLLGHEAAHLVKRHGETGATRTKTLQGLGSLIGMGLGMAGVPAGGTIAGFAVDLIDSSYNRDQEQEADTLGVGYMMSAGFDPEGAIRLHEKVVKASGGSLLPFLSSHPSGEERIENLKALIRNRSDKGGP